MSNYIYLIQEREFITTNQNIYKLGKTKQENLERFKRYPKGSKLLLHQVCDDCDVLEIELIRDFKNKYKHRRDIGYEYFEGDYKDMIKDIHNKIIYTIISNNTDNKVSEVGEVIEEDQSNLRELENLKLERQKELENQELKRQKEAYSKHTEIQKKYYENHKEQILNQQKTYRTQNKYNENRRKVLYYLNNSTDYIMKCRKDTLTKYKIECIDGKYI
jgi:hypothetical protein